MAAVNPAFYDTFKAQLGARLYAIANEETSVTRHAERAAIARHVLADWDGALQQLLCVYTSNFQGAAEDAMTVGTNLDIVLDTFARLAVWGP